MSRNLFGEKSSNWKGGKIEIKCTHCGESLFRNKCNISKERGNFCNNKCYGEWQSKNIVKEKVANYAGGLVATNCIICKKTFYTYPLRIKRGESKFCGHGCFSEWKKSLKAEKSNQWRGGKILVKCEQCGKEFKVYPSDVSNGGGRFCKHECYGAWRTENMRGEKNTAWKGGTTQESVLIRGHKKSEVWRKSVFERDGYACKVCGDKTGGNLRAHHIKHFSKIIQEIKEKYPLLSTTEISGDCKELWDISNGITLCEPCHKMEHKKK